MSTFFRVDHDTPTRDESVNKVDKGIIIVRQGKCRESSKNKSLRTRQLKRGIRNKQKSKPKSSRKLNNKKISDRAKRDMYNNVKCVYFNARSIVNKQKRTGVTRYCGRYECYRYNRNLTM